MTERKRDDNEILELKNPLYHDDDVHGMGHLSDRRHHQQNNSPKSPIAGNSFENHCKSVKKNI